MHYVYILKSLKDAKLYVGRSDDLKRRIKQHMLGKVTSTKNRRPLLLVYYEAFLSKADVIRRETYLKTSKGKTTLKVMLTSSLKS